MAAFHAYATPVTGPAAHHPAGRHSSNRGNLNLPVTLALGLVWLAHIGLDRLLGYGLKYGDHFHHTHLGGHPAESEDHRTG